MGIEFTRKPGDPERIIEPVELPEGPALIMAEHPDYVNLPAELAEQFNLPRQANVVAVHALPWQGQLRIHYKLDAKVNNKTLWVAKADQFYWHTRD